MTPAPTEHDQGTPRDRGASLSRWALGAGRSLDLSRPRIVAILNVTPDSFSDGGALPTVEAAARRAREAVDQGADALDVGGESTRPGAQRVGAGEQIERVVPPIRAIREAGIGAPISVDTTLVEVARAALDAGADAINDVSGGTEDPAILALAAERGAGLVLMHRLRAPDADEYSHAYAKDPVYEGGVVDAVARALVERRDAALEAGVPIEAIVLDPGLGFGKSVAQNYALLARLGEVVRRVAPCPVLAGASRKSFIGAATGRERPADRVAGSVAAAAIAALGGARLLRVHDVRETVEALAVAGAALEAASEAE